MERELNSNIEERKRKEKEHSDRRRSVVKAFEYYTDTNKNDEKEKFVHDVDNYEYNFSNMKFYSITRSSMCYRDNLLYKNIKNSIALDYCCGNGEIAIEMAKRGAKKVYGIDISSVAIENANNLAREENVSNICEFAIMDAEKTEFDKNEFDVIHEYGALHHLDLKAAYSELSRILKTQGHIVCTEAMRHNPLIHWYRTRTPHLRTEWEVEHILGIPEIKKANVFFSDIDYRMFHLAVLAAVPWRKTKYFSEILKKMERIDDLILKMPFIKSMAWISVIELSNPSE